MRPTSTWPGCRAPSRSRWSRSGWPRSERYDAVICLGAVIRGSTPHFDYVAGEVAKGVAKVQLDAGVPVIFGVLTTDTIEQAVERAGTKAGNKGWDAAVSALEMANLLRDARDGTESAVEGDGQRPRERAGYRGRAGSERCSGRATREVRG